MAWETFTCAGTLFATTLADRAVANGWTRCETGYNWIKPAAVAQVALGRMFYLTAIRIYTEISATGYQYTIFEPAVREYYDAVAHAGAGYGWVGWGNPITTTAATADYTARDFTFEGWMDSNCIFGNVKPDPTIPGVQAFPIFFCVAKGFDGINRLVGLDMMPSGAAYRCNARLIHAAESIAYWNALQAGGFGAWGFDNKARLSRLYSFRGGVAVADLVNPAAIQGVFENPTTGIPYVLGSDAQGVEVYNDEVILTIAAVDYYYRCLYPSLTPPQYFILTDKASNFNATAVPARLGVDKILTYWVRRL